MSRPRILVVYGTRYGHTAAIATRVAAMLDELGYRSIVRDAAAGPPEPGWADIDGVIVASSVIFGRHQRSVERFVRRHRNELDAVPAAFLSVSGAAWNAQPDASAAARRQLELFVRRTGWRPRDSLCVGGAVSYTKYPSLVRWMVRSLMRRAGGPTDTSRDHDRTDWGQLSEFVAEFTTLVPNAPTAPVITGRP